MWVVHEGVVKLYDADVLFLMLGDVGLLSLWPAGTPGTMNKRADVLVNAHQFHILEVRLVSVEFEVLRLTNWIVDVIHQDAPLAVKTTLLSVAKRAQC